MKPFNQSIEELIKIAEQEIYAGNFHQAIKLLENGLLDEPGYAKLHYTLAWMNHYHLDNKMLAERHYQLTIFFDPEFKDAYEYLSALYYDNKKLKGLKILMAKADEVSEIEKDFVYSMLGKVAEAEAKFSDALYYYKKALIHCMDNDDSKALKLNIKRTKFKRLRKSLRKWQLKKLPAKI